MDTDLRQLKRQNAPVEAVTKELAKRRLTVSGACWLLKHRFDAEDIFRAFCVLLDHEEIKWTGARTRTGDQVWRAA